MKEIRFYKFSALRASGDGKRITGYAAVFNQMSEDLGGFREIVLPGAFDRCLRGAPDVRCLFNHNPDVVLGRTKSGTLRLGADTSGLKFDCDVPNTQAGRDVRESIRRGDIDQCSFGFVVNGQKWREQDGADGKPQSIRELTDVDLFDVSPVTYAAYPQTSVSARVLWPEGEPAEVRSHHSTAPKGMTPAPAEKPAPAAKSEFLVRMENCKTAAEQVALIATKLGQPVSVRRFSNMAIPYTPAEMQELRKFLESGQFQKRDLTTGGAAGAFIAETFNSHVFEAMKVYDELFDDSVTTHIETETGQALNLFGIDDTTNSASIPGEGVGSSEVDPASLQKLQLADAPTWDSGVTAVSQALLQDQKADLPGLLARSFGIRLARGIGQSLASTLASSAILGATATGDPNTSGATGANSIGYQDLVNLKGSVNKAYRASTKVFWLMNDDTLTALDNLLDKQGRPIIQPVYLNGRRILLGFPVAICPSIPNIGAAAKSVYFGATDRFVVRIVAPGGKGADNRDNGRLVRLYESVGYAENLLVGYKSFLRCNGGLLDVTNNGSPASPDSPVKYLQNAA